MQLKLQQKKTAPVFAGTVLLFIKTVIPEEAGVKTCLGSSLYSRQPQNPSQTFRPNRYWHKFLL